MSQVGAVGPGAAPPAAAPGAAEGVRLAAGTVVEAQILESAEPGSGRVAVGRWVLDARFPAELPQGARFQARVEVEGPPVVLRLLEPPEADAARLAVPPRQALARAVVRLLEAARSDPDLAPLARLLRLSPEPRALASDLARWVRESGVFHESALARGEVPEDLKTLAGRLLGRLGDGPVREALEGLVRHVEAHQARGALTGGPVIPLVLPWPGGAVHGEIALEPERGGRGGPGRRYRALRIRLDLPNLGPVEVRAAWSPEGVRLGLAARAEVLPLVRARLDGLRRALTRDAGVRLVGLAVEALRPPAVEGPSVLEVRA
ncbi:flagellar hook-length control protein FliK [Deferrisoma camini]|uniref:flagellar hook-length control protein FliK n=1 Tax=Deferrisoma camini TaxID=1035120 RepID=UPI000A07A55A|nr:flagellar hook-length control protein FliK [Deferrisoma camini]